MKVKLLSKDIIKHYVITFLAFSVLVHRCKKKNPTFFSVDNFITVHPLHNYDIDIFDKCHSIVNF